MTSDIKLKQTEIGLIPQDWEVEVVGKTIDVIRGVSWRKNEVSNSGVKVLTIPNVRDGMIDYNTNIYLNKRINKEKLLKPGDTIVVASSGSIKNIGRSAFFDGTFPEDICVASFLLILRPKEKVYKYFLYYLSKSELLKLSNFGRRAADGKFNFQVNEFRRAFLPLPPLPEQQKIASVLSKIQQAIEQQDKIIQKTKELKKSLMHKLFTEGLYGEEQKETEIGLIPKSWEIKAVNDTCDKPQYGYTERAMDRPIGPKFLRITDMTERGVDWSKVPYCKCPAELIEKYRLKTGDILFARIGATTGKSFIVKDCPLAIYASYLIRIRTKSGLNSLYLFYFFNSEAYWRQINANKDANLKKGVSGSVLAQLLLPIPPIEEQKEIADILSNVDKKIQKAEARKKALQDLFKTMLNQLMTGKIRVKDLNIEVKEDVRA